MELFIIGNYAASARHKSFRSSPKCNHREMMIAAKKNPFLDHHELAHCDYYIEITSSSYVTAEQSRTLPAAPKM